MIVGWTCPATSYKFRGADVRAYHGEALAISTPEAMARLAIDELLRPAGWFAQDRVSRALGAGRGVAVGEYRLPAGPCDYLLFVDRKAAGVVEAKPAGRTLIG